MTTAAQHPTPVRISSPADLLGVVPSMLGFHPAHSVVLVCLAGPRRRSMLTMRADLPDRTHLVLACRELAERAAGAGTDAVMVVVYDAVRGRSAPLPHRRLVRRLCRALDHCGIEVVDVVLRGNERWWSYLCTNTSCCPPEGTPLPPEPTPAALRFQAEAVAKGGRVWPDREHLAASVAAPDADQAAALLPVHERVRSELVERAATGAADDVGNDTVALLHDLHVRYRDGSDRVTAEESARLALGLADVQVRDAVLVWGGGAHPGALLSVLLDAVRQTIAPTDAPLCTTLAWVAYQAGDGALAQCALDRALESDPEYHLAVLLRAGLDRGVPPSALAQASLASALDGDHGDAMPSDDYR